MSAAVAAMESSTLSPWFERHKENLAWAGVIVGTALLALGIGICFIGQPGGLKGRSHLQSPLYSDIAVTRILGLFSCVFGFATIFFISFALKEIREEENKKFDIPLVRKILLVVAVFITLLAIGMIIGGKTTQNSAAFSYEKNAQFYSAQKWHEIENGITAALAAGSISLCIGAGVGLLALASTIPEKIASRIDAWRTQRAKAQASRELHSAQGVDHD